MNGAVAVAEIDGPEAGLAILDRLDYRYFRFTRASPAAPAPDRDRFSRAALRCR